MKCKIGAKFEEDIRQAFAVSFPLSCWRRTEPIISWGKDYGGGKIGKGKSKKKGLEQPVYYWVPSIATSGLAFYTGELFPTWKGNALVGGLAGAVLERLVLKGEKVVGVERLLQDRADRIRDVRVGPDGAVYVLTDAIDGKILRITPKN